MNLNVYHGAGHRSLGLIRIVCSMNSSKVIELAVNKLDQLGLDLVASTNDAASVLGKFGKDTSQNACNASVIRCI